jgi:hypothetical protein
LKAIVLGRRFDRLVRRRLALLREEKHPDGKHFRQPYSTSLGSFAEELLRYCGEQAGAITAASIRVYAAAMSQSGQRDERSFHDFVRSRAAQLRNKANATGVMVGREGVTIFRHRRECLPLFGPKNPIENFDSRDGFFRTGIPTWHKQCSSPVFMRVPRTLPPCKSYLTVGARAVNIYSPKWIVIQHDQAQPPTSDS